MLHDFAVAVTSLVTIMGSLLVHDAQQLSKTVGDLIPRPAGTSVSYSGAPLVPLQAATETTAGHPFHASATASPSIGPSRVAVASAIKKSIPASHKGSKPSAMMVSASPGQVLGTATSMAPDFVTLFDLNALEARIDAKIAALASPPPFPEQVAAAGVPAPYGAPPSFLTRIDNLDGVTIRNATIIGGSLSGTTGAGGIGDNASTTTFFSAVGHFTSGIIDALSSAAGTINDLTSNTITATNVTFTNATTTNFAATNASTTKLTTGSLTLGGQNGVLYATSGVVASLANGADGKVLKLSGGVLTWGTDLAGSGGSSLWATTTDSLGAYLSPVSTVLLVGASATTTTGNVIEVAGNALIRGSTIAYKSVTAPSFVATSSVASQLPYASTTAITATTASTTNLFLSLVAPSSILKTTAGGQVVAAVAGTDYLTASSIFGFPFTPTTFGATAANATSTLTGFTNGIFATGSSTIQNVSIQNSTTTNATTTSFAITNITSGSLLKIGIGGALTAAVGGVDYANFAYLFAGNATTTLLNFNGGLSATIASTTNLSSSYASSTSGFFGSLSVGSLSGILRATAGVIATSLINLAADVTGILPVANGGTGWANLAAGAVPYGNGTNALATTSAGLPGQVLALLNGVPTWTSTTTLSSIGGILGVGNGGTGATTFGQGWIYSTGGAVALAASTSPTVNYITATSTTATSTFAGAISVAGSSGLSVLQNGNVGVGDIAPGTKLSVLGNAAIGFASGQTAPSNGFLVRGNVGIGTTTPYALLSLWGTTATSGLFAFMVTNSASTTNFAIDNAGFISAGASTLGTPSGVFTIDASSSTTTISNLSLGNLVFDTDAGIVNLSDLPVDSNAAAGVQQAQIINIGGNPLIVASGISNGSGGVTNLNVGIGTSTTPYSTLQVWGRDASSSTSAFAVVNNSSTTVFTVFDGGNAQLSGTLTQSSDQRLKTNVQSLAASTTLGLISQLNPVTFSWIDTSLGTAPQLGFIAQDVLKLFPTLVSTTSPTRLTPDGTLGVNYIGFIAPIVEAIKALVAEINGFAESFTTHRVNTDTLCVNKSDGIPVCVNGDQLAAVLTSSGQPSTGTSSTPPPSSSTTDVATSPVIQINGNNPDHILVGDTYNDLGAIITGPQADLYLGIHTFVGTTPIEQAVIDTSTTTVYHINYVATDGAGNAATSTRTLYVDAPVIAPPDASSTDATSTTP